MKAFPSKDMKRLDDNLDDAEIAFWGVIAERYPEATHGDFPPDATFELEAALKKAAILWLEWNADPQGTDILTTEILFHRIEYFYFGFDDLSLTDGDREHIAYCITNGISEGDLCTYIQAGQEVRGYWKINNG